MDLLHEDKGLILHHILEVQGSDRELDGEEDHGF
jgi:hypothetical protein